MNQGHRRPAGAIEIPRPRPTAKRRLICFPFGGGSRSSFEWLHDRLPENYELVTAELAPSDSPEWATVATTERLSAQAAAFADVYMDMFAEKQYVLFGYSFGALAALETARRLRARGAASPMLLVLAACASPALRRTTIDTRGFPRPDAPCEDLLRALVEYQFMPPGLLEDEELSVSIAERFRADYMLFFDYKFHPSKPFSCPIVALGGMGDPLAHVDDLEGWRGQTSSALDVIQLPGSHMFVKEDKAAFARILFDALQGVKD